MLQRRGTGVKPAFFSPTKTAPRADNDGVSASSFPPVSLSVVIPCFNAAATIGLQLEALARQECNEPWEIVVVDNGSTDGSRACVEAMRERLPNLRFARAAARRGASFARNEGVRLAQGERIVFVDADDEVAAGFIAAMAAGIDLHGFVAARLDAKELNHSWASRNRNPAQMTCLQTGSVHPTLPYAGGGTLGIRKSIHDSVGGFDEGLLAHEDTDYCLRVQLAGHPLHFWPDALIHLRWPETFLHSCRQLRSWAFHAAKVRGRHWPREAVRCGPWRHAGRVVRQMLKLWAVHSADGFRLWAWSGITEVGWWEGVVYEQRQRHDHAIAAHPRPTGQMAGVS